MDELSTYTLVLELHWLWIIAHGNHAHGITSLRVDEKVNRSELYQALAAYWPTAEARRSGSINLGVVREMPFMRIQQERKKARNMT